MHYYLGIDIGTTSAKAVAFSDSGEIVSSHCSYYQMHHPQSDQSEMDADEIVAGVMDIIKKTVEAMAGNQPRFMAFSSAMHSIMVIDAEGRPLTRCIIWADNRAAQIAEELLNSDKAGFIYHNTGVPIHAMSPLCKLLWFKKYQPEIFYNASMFIGIKEYVLHKFTGQYLVDTSIASATGLLNIHTLTWDADIMQMLQVSPSCLSRVVSPEYIIGLNNINCADAMQLYLGISIVVGASDGTLANLGAGAHHDNAMVVSIGTSAAARLIVSDAETDDKMRTFCYHLHQNKYVVGGPCNNGAIVLQWLKDKLLETSDTYAGMFLRAEQIEPGSESLLFLPYILGERAPIWNSSARGVFFGLNINHTSSHLIRACMEGITFGVYGIVKILLEKREVKSIYATGGFAQSDVWLQMVADVCDLNVCVSQAVEASALGAVMLGIEATNEKPFTPAKASKIFVPSAEAHAVYMNSFNRFESLYSSLSKQWVKQEADALQMLL